MIIIIIIIITTILLFTVCLHGAYTETLTCFASVFTSLRT